MAEENATVVENKMEVEEKTEASEEYAYLDRGGFSSEMFKIELRGLPKFYGIAELKKLMNQKLGLNTSKIKRPRNGSQWLYACFQNDEERSKAIEALNGFSWKGKTLLAEVAKPAPDPLVRKRKQDEEKSEQQKRKKEDENVSQEERLKNATTPYWNMPYEEQLKLKENEIRNILMKFDNEVWKIDRSRRNEIESKRKEYKGLSFELRPIEKSPVTLGYRNKCEFTVGIDDETKLPTVGFRLGSYVTGTVGVGPIQSMIHISEKTKKAVLLFQDFIRKSKLAPFSPVDYSGHWRYLTVRDSTATGDVMLIVAMYPQSLTENELNEIKNDLIEHFKSEEALTCGVKSLYFQQIIKRRVGEEPSKPLHLSGSTHITDTILGKQFRISPEAFFQINTAGAEVLYRSAIEMSQVKSDSTVIDICCGTGTIGLCFAQILVALSFYATGSYQRLVGGTQGTMMSQQSVSRALMEVTDALNSPMVVQKWLKFPETRQERDLVKRRFFENFKIPSVIGCIDGTHVAIIRPSQNEERFYNRKGYHSRNVLIHCGRVLGLELIAEAVKDAKANAELNNIENCEFFTGKAEDILPSVLARTNEDDIIAIVDPPRAGLHMRAVTQLRNTKKVKRLVYISCSPSSVVKNFIDLARPSSKTLRGAPFLPVRAVPVDMFPQTKHVELAILFERESSSENEAEITASSEDVNTTEQKNSPKETDPSNKASVDANIEENIDNNV